MELDAQTILGVLGLSGAAGLTVGAWILSVEKRINGLKGLHTKVDKLDYRTEQMSLALLGRDVAKDKPRHDKRSAD